MSEERPLTVVEVARWLSCSERTVEREIAAGRLPAAVRVLQRNLWRRGAQEMSDATMKNDAALDGEAKS